MSRRGNKRKRGDARLRVVPSDEVRQRVEMSVELQPLMREIRSRMRDEDPMALCGFVSTMIAATDGRFGYEDLSPVALEDLIDSFIDVDIAETTALLHTLSAFAPTEAMRGRVDSALARRRQPMPRWLTELPSTTVTRVSRMGFPLDPGQNFLVEFRWPGGRIGTYVIFDAGLGRGVNDAFPAADTLEGIIEHMRRAGPAGLAPTFDAMDLATARATIEQGLANGADPSPDEEDELWPSGRPFVEWLLTLMPAGGTPDPSTTTMPDLSAAALDDLFAADLDWLEDDEELPEFIEEFIDSAEAARIDLDLDDVHDYSALMAISEYASMPDGRDPLRWDTDRVDEFLLSHLPAEALPDPLTARRIPVVLEAYLTWAAGQTGMSAKQKKALLKGLPEVASSYLDIALSPQAQALREALADYEDLTELWDEFGIRTIGEETEGGFPGFFDDLEDDEDFETMVLESLARHVGGPQALDSLDDTPLPDEELDLSAVPTDIHERVREVQALVDDFADQSFGVELRTAARRFLARAAAGDPAIFRRASRADTAAAAVAWIAARGNHLVGTQDASMTVRELMDFFGVSGSPTTRAQAFLKAVDTAYYTTGNPVLGSADLLTGPNRAEIIGLRDRASSDQGFDFS